MFCPTTKKDGTSRMQHVCECVRFGEGFDSFGEGWRRLEEVEGSEGWRRLEKVGGGWRR